MTETLPLTGERTAPGIWHENYWFARHDVAYRWITSTLPVAGRIVLDAGCGEGYGADHLRSAGARSVIALDYEPTALRHVARKYPRLNPVRGNLVRTGFAGQIFDLVTSLQTIEHLWEQPRFIRECARILQPHGTLVLTTPNRLTFPPGNWYHTRELTAAELMELVAADLEVVQVLGLHHGKRLRAWEADHGSCVDAQLATPHDDWPDHLRQLVNSVTSEDFELSTEDLDGCLDLLLVGQGRTKRSRILPAIR